MKKLFGAAKLAHEKKMRKHHRKGKKHMARRKSASRTTIVRAPAPIVRVSAPRAPKRHHRAHHYARAFGSGVNSEKGAIVAIAAAIGLGLLEKSGTKIPTIGPLGPAGTAAIALYIYGRMAKSPTAKTMAVGLGSVAMNRWAATGQIAGDVMGQGVVFPE